LTGSVLARLVIPDSGAADILVVIWFVAVKAFPFTCCSSLVVGPSCLASITAIAVPSSISFSIDILVVMIGLILSDSECIFEDGFDEVPRPLEFWENDGLIFEPFLRLFSERHGKPVVGLLVLPVERVDRGLDPCDDALGRHVVLVRPVEGWQVGHIVVHTT
jgi:hypothetical protein